MKDLIRLTFFILLGFSVFTGNPFSEGKKPTKVINCELEVNQENYKQCRERVK